MTVHTPLATEFFAYVALMAGLVAVVLVRFLPKRSAIIALSVLTGWLIYAGALGYAGVVRGLSFGIPGIFVLLAPIFVFVAVVARSSGRLTGQLGVSARIERSRKRYKPKRFGNYRRGWSISA
jgi:uncharacterized membrane protein